MTKCLSREEEKNRAKIRKLEKESGVTLHDCYQCGKCSAGCPMAESMDKVPRQVIRYLQLGLLDEALQARSPWICATCGTCSARCPHDVKIAELMETVRMMAERAGYQPVRNVRLFTKDFMKPVRQFGRAHEMTMTAFYNIQSGRLFQHFSYLPQMVRGGKLKIIPERVKGREAVRRIMDNCEREAEKL